MARKAETYGQQKDGTFKISYRDEFWQTVKNMGDGRFRVSIEKIYRKRSLSQNAYYHSVVVQCLLDGVYDMWGEKHSHDWAHELLKEQCNYVEKLNQLTGELMHIPQSTANETTAEFMEFIERCCKFISENFGVTVPEPGEQSELEFK